MLAGDRVHVESSGAVAAESIVKAGVPQNEDVDAIAVRSEHSVRVLVWNYRDDDVAGAAADVDLKIAGLPLDLTRVSLRHFRIDETHSNAYTVFKAGGSREAMLAAGQLQMLGSPGYVSAVKGAVEGRFELPLQGLSLVEISW
jgi:xylan 1,4-beta-xylosidase